MLNGYPEFLVTIEPNDEEGLQDFVLCEVRTVEEAIDYAFGTRNIASSWKVTNVESDDVEISTSFPVTFRQWRHWHRFVALTN